MADRWPELDAYLRSRGIRVGTATSGQTTGGTHATGSYHYLGLARDHGLYNCDCSAIAAALAPLATGPNYVIVELIWTPASGKSAGTYFKNGGRYVPADKLANGHRDHVHDAIRPGAPNYTQWPGYVSPKPKGFLMALTDAQQGDVYNYLTELHNKATFGGTAHPNFGDLVNEVVKQVNAHTDAKIAEAIAALKP